VGKPRVAQLARATQVGGRPTGSADRHAKSCAIVVPPKTGLLLALASSKMSDDRYVEHGSGRDLVSAGAEIAGSTAGAAVGLVFAGPAGALAGAAAGPILNRTLGRVANEIGQRVLGHRERVRAGAAVAYAAERFEALAERGATIRDDGFFTDLPDGRNQAREVAEGVLLAARNSYEERKVRHIGYLFANVAVLPEIDSGLAALALRRAEELTWRQYVVLAAVHRHERRPLPPGQLSDDPGEWMPWGCAGSSRTCTRPAISFP
jgi:hypothetical protein